MTTIILRVVDETEAERRPVMDTGVSMVGLGGDRGVCGRCGREIMTDVPFRAMRVDMLFRCGACGALNEAPRDD